MVRHRIQREHEPRNVFYLALDVISLIPIYEAYVLLTSVSRYIYETNWVRHIGRTKVILRLYRVFVYFSVVGSQAGINQVYVLTFAELFRVYIITIMLAAWWYNISCWKCSDVKNWTDHLQYFRFNPRSPWDWFVLCYMSMGSYLMYNYRGTVHAVTVLERVTVIWTMVVGFSMHGMYYLGCLTEAMQKNCLRQYEFERRLSLIMDLLVEWEMPGEIKDRTMEYYVTLWERRNGIPSMPKSFELLPQPLQKEVALDVFFEALRHSHIFRDKSVAFKRALSLKMKCEFYLPGDYVFQLKQLKNKMVYIVSGVIQILTEEDEESPIMSFSNGSLLSEVSVLLPLESGAHVRCATYCEVQTLSFCALYGTLLVFPEETASIRHILKERLMKAAELKELKVRKNYSSSAIGSQMNALNSDSAIQWIKKRWRHLMYLQVYTSYCFIPHLYLILVSQTQDKMKAKSMLSNYVETEHTSRNLDMLVLSDDFELKTKAICMNSKCPFILEPSSSFRKFCGYCILIVIIMQCILIPYLVFVIGRKDETFASLLMVFDAAYFVDIYLQVPIYTTNFRWTLKC